jgi:hypothetical protein
MATWLHSEQAHRLIAGMAVGAWSGFLAAFEADLSRFKDWQSWGDVRAYDWGLATFRWCKGIGLGMIAGLSGGAALGL